MATDKQLAALARGRETLAKRAAERKATTEAPEQTFDSDTPGERQEAPGATQASPKASNPGGIDLGLVGRSLEQGLRGRKMVAPSCQVPVVVHGKTEWTTGPCQQQVKESPTLRYSWFKTCPHGPEFDEHGQAIPEERRPYYETDIYEKRTPVLGPRGEIKEWKQTEHYSARLRVVDVALAETIMSGRAVNYRLARGALPVSDFGLAPFCEAYGCMRQKTQQFKNGRFCSALHAKFVKARETGTMVPVGGFDTSWPMATSTQKRNEVLAAVEV